MIQTIMKKESKPEEGACLGTTPLKSRQQDLLHPECLGTSQPQNNLNSVGTATEGPFQQKQHVPARTAEPGSTGEQFLSRPGGSFILKDGIHVSSTNTQGHLFNWKKPELIQPPQYDP